MPISMQNGSGMTRQSAIAEQEMLDKRWEMRRWKLSVLLCSCSLLISVKRCQYDAPGEYKSCRYSCPLTLSTCYKGRDRAGWELPPTA